MGEWQTSDEPEIPETSLANHGGRIGERPPRESKELGEAAQRSLAGVFPAGENRWLRDLWDGRGCRWFRLCP